MARIEATGGSILDESGHMTLGRKLHSDECEAAFGSFIEIVQETDVTQAQFDRLEPAIGGLIDAVVREKTELVLINPHVQNEYLKTQE